MTSPTHYAGGKLELISSESSDISVPRDSEFVLEGFIDFNELVDEGPFVDLTGTYDGVRKQPVITFERMHYSSGAVYQAVVAALVNTRCSWVFLRN